MNIEHQLINQLRALRLGRFDFSFNPKIKRSQIKDLATCIFLEKKEHVLIYGPAGIGKTHIAQALSPRSLS